MAPNPCPVSLSYSFSIFLSLSLRIYCTIFTKSSVVGPHLSTRPHHDRMLYARPRTVMAIKLALVSELLLNCITFQKNRRSELSILDMRY